MAAAYDDSSRQYVGIDLHRRRSVIVRQTADGEVLEQIRIDNDAMALALEIEKAGPNPEVVLEATYGWYWAADVLAATGATVHLAHPLGVKGWTYRRVKNDEVDAGGLADLLRMNRLPESWIAPPQVRQLRELVRHRAKLVALRSGLKSQVHAVLAKEGVAVPMTDLFGKAGMQLLADVPLGRAYRLRVSSLLDVIDAFDYEIGFFTRTIAEEFKGHAGYRAIPGHRRGGPDVRGGVRRRDRRRHPLP
jgi:transposase